MLFKSCPVRVKAAGSDDGLEDGQFEALVSVFGNKDSYGDVVMPGAFTDTLAEWSAKGDPIPVYYSHRMDDPDYNIGYVLEAKETDDGLWVKAQMDTDPEARKAAQVHRLLKGRRVTQFSFAYDIVEGGFETHDGEDVYALKRLKLYEVGPTPIGANDSTELLGVKSAEALAQRIAHGVKEGRVLAAKHIDSLRSAQEAIGSVIEAAGGNDQEKASGESEAKSGASDEEPEGAKSSVSDEEPKAGPSVARLAAEAHIYALMGGQEGVQS